MALDLSRLQTAVDHLIADVEVLVAKLPDPTEAEHVQAQLDSLASALEAESAKVEGPVPPVAPTV